MAWDETIQDLQDLVTTMKNGERIGASCKITTLQLDEMNAYRRTRRKGLPTDRWLKFSKDDNGRRIQDPVCPSCECLCREAGTCPSCGKTVT